MTKGSNHGVCENCGCQYTIHPEEVDDGYCSFDCWEEHNCSKPIEKMEVLETSLRDIVHNG